MTTNELAKIPLRSQACPKLLEERLGPAAPSAFSAIGDHNLLNIPKIALFCSTRCPGDTILAACDQATRWRDEGRCIIGGFHSPVEKECLRILLAGKQPIIICPARSLEGMRIPTAWRDGIAQGRILLLSPFPPAARRQSAALARQRNAFVAAFADDIYTPYVTPGGSIEAVVLTAKNWGVTIRGA